MGVITAFIIINVRRTITIPLLRTVDSAKIISSGDLTVEDLQEVNYVATELSESAQNLQTEVQKFRV